MSNFIEISQRGCADIAIFPFFMMAAGGHHGFLNPGNVNGWQRPMRRRRDALLS